MNADRPDLPDPVDGKGRLMRTDDIRYHQARAAHEFDAGCSASCANAARAHLELSALHTERARELGAANANAGTDTRLRA